MAVQPGLCRTLSETPKTGFLTTRLILKLPLNVFAKPLHPNVSARLSRIIIHVLLTIQYVHVRVAFAGNNPTILWLNVIQTR